MPLTYLLTYLAAVFVLVGMNQQQLQQILAVAAVVAPMIQNSQMSANQMPASAVNQQPAVNQQNPGNLLSVSVFSCIISSINLTIRCISICDSGEMAEHLLISCPPWAAERQRHFSDSIDIKDVFWDYVNLVEFPISSGHLSLHIDNA